MIRDEYCNFLNSYGCMYQGFGHKSGFGTDIRVWEIYIEVREIYKGLQNISGFGIYIWVRNTYQGLEHTLRFGTYIRVRNIYQGLEHISRFETYIKV